MSLEVKVTDTIHKKVDIVFNAIIDKDELSKYFVSYASANLIENTKVKWEWTYFCAECEMSVLTMEKNKKILLILREENL